jgi:hypothetical protein
MVKKTSREILGPATGINEPQVDWAPLWQAPYFCTVDGYITSPEGWKRTLLAEVQQHTSKYPHRPEWSFSSNSAETEITISAMGITTNISPGRIYLHSGEKYVALESWHTDKILQDSGWVLIPANEQKAARWHRLMLGHLFSFWHSNFVRAVRSGTAHIMARKNSALAAFERITWDQWQFFSLDPEEHFRGRSEPEIWYDPREPHYSHHVVHSATGPAGERLYAIYVAPGLETKKSLTAEKKCQQWLVELLREYPERPPYPLSRLTEDAVSKFPRLSKRGFQRAYFSAQIETGNRSWSRPGAPSKSLQESPHKK